MEYFFTSKFLISLAMISILLILFLIVKEGLKKHLSLSYQYFIGYLFFFLLAMPFLPCNYAGVSLFGRFFSGTETSMVSFSIPYPLYTVQGEKGTGVSDFAVSAEYFSGQKILWVCFFIWLAGFLFLFSCFLYSAFQWNQIRKKYSIPDRELKSMLEDCKGKLNITKEIEARKSHKVFSPVIFGLLHPVILLPEKMDQMVSKKEIQYILLHELMHYKKKDIFVNYFIYFFQSVYWFHPVVWYAFKKMQEDREILCDRLVLNSLKQESHLEYGMTILHFIENRSKKIRLPLTADLGGSKKQIKRRIEEIASFSKETMILKYKSRMIFVLLFLILLSQMPFISISAQEFSQFKNTNVIYEDMGDVFKEYEGSFVLYDLKKDLYTVFNEKQSKKRISPDSTYKIYSALTALENGIISEEYSDLEWNGIESPFSEWNQNQNLFSAMQNSVNWYFDELNQRVGFSELKKSFQAIQYGNADFSGGQDSFWAESSLKISPYEQVALLKKMYLKELPFAEENVLTVQSAMRISQKENGSTLFGKTGTGMIQDKNKNGWFIGFVEKGDSVFLFSTNIQGKDGATGGRAFHIALEILEKKGIY